jgi:hypothetical protein
MVASMATAQPAERRPELGCESNPAVVEPCFMLHGRIQVANGSNNVRLWWIGTRRVLFVAPDEDPIAPRNLRRHLDFGRSIYGDFRVCPFARDMPGRMRPVCIQEASNLVIEDSSDPEENKPPRISFDRAAESLPLTAP